MAATAPIQLDEERHRHRRPAQPRSRATPAQIVVEKNDIVGTCMDLNALATEAIYANGHAIQVALYGLPPSPERSAIQSALLDSHKALKALVVGARDASRRYETTPSIR